MICKRNLQMEPALKELRVHKPPTLSHHTQTKRGREREGEREGGTDGEGEGERERNRTREWLK